MNDDEPVHVDPFASPSSGTPSSASPPSTQQSRAEGDARRQDDPTEPDDCFGPPQEPCECYCLHCGRTFMSTGIWFQRIRNARPGQFDGFWMCPTPNCDGKGFTFDIFPTDPNHPANEGWYDDAGDTEWEEEFDVDEEGEIVEAEYDPDETKWKQMDEELGGDECEDDFEGEEWKYGLQPGERPPEPDWLAGSQREWDEEQSKYDTPDERPREIDWEEPDRSASTGEPLDEDDIPF